MILACIVRNLKPFIRMGAGRTNQALKAMDDYRSVHPLCAWCGGNQKVEVHHIRPVHTCPERAADQSNMISLCRKHNCHLVVGHVGSYRDRWVENVRSICQMKIDGKEGTRDLVL